MARLERYSETTSENVIIKPNEKICLVYDVEDQKGKRLTRKDLFSTVLKDKRQLPTAEAERKRIRVCADGDLWINILWPFSAIAGYNPTFFDIIQNDFSYQTADRAYPGDTFQQIRSEKDYRPLIESGSFDFFIFSGGGNDILGGGALRNLLKWRDEVSGPDPKKYIHTLILKDALDTLRSGYQEIAKDVWARSLPGRTRMLVNTYDYAVPRRNGVWLGKPLTDLGYDLRSDKVLIEGIIKHLVDSFHAMLSRVRHVTVVDVRNTVNGRWNDELHPKQPASVDIAAKFKSVMQAVS